MRCQLALNRLERVGLGEGRHSHVIMHERREIPQPPRFSFAILSSLLLNSVARLYFLLFWPIQRNTILYPQSFPSNIVFFHIFKTSRILLQGPIWMHVEKLHTSIAPN